MLDLCAAPVREMAQKYNIKYFYDIQDRSNFKANPDYKGVCHVALAQVGQKQGFVSSKSLLALFLAAWHLSVTVFLSTLCC